METKCYETAGLAERPLWWKVRTGEVEDFCRNIKKSSPQTLMISGGKKC